MTDTKTATDLVAEIYRLMEQLRAIVETGSQAPQDGALPGDLMRPGDIVHEFGIPRSTLHRLCRANPINNSNDGFAFFDPVKQRYLISRSKVAAYFRRHGTNWDVKPR